MKRQYWLEQIEVDTSYVPPTRQEREFARDQRLRKRYKTEAMVSYVWKVQELWHDYFADHNIRPLFQKLEKMVGRKSKALERRWRSLRITQKDFECVLWEIAWLVADSYDWESR